jgi:hypothetical protein
MGAGGTYADFTLTGNAVDFIEGVVTAGRGGGGGWTAGEASLGFGKNDSVVG